MPQTSTVSLISWTREAVLKENSSSWEGWILLIVPVPGSWCKPCRLAGAHRSCSPGLGSCQHRVWLQSSLHYGGQWRKGRRSPGMWWGPCSPLRYSFFPGWQHGGRGIRGQVSCACSMELWSSVFPHQLCWLPGTINTLWRVCCSESMVWKALASLASLPVVSVCIGKTAYSCPDHYQKNWDTEVHSLTHPLLLLPVTQQVV